jgi:CDP-glucose 4,6-dehydratase
VLESLSGYLSLAAALVTGQVTAAGDGQAAGAWNFGPPAGDVVSVQEVVETVVREWGTGEWQPAPGAAEQPHEAGLLVLDAGKAERELGWRPVWGTEEAIAATVRWYKAYTTGAGADELAGLCRDDIARYCAAAAAAGAAWTAAEVSR